MKTANIAILVMITFLTACANMQNTHSHNSERLRTWEYDIHSYQPACYVTTTRHASGAILGQVTQCPPKQYYCTLKSTGSRIECPKFNPKNFEEDYAILEDAHYKEDCRLVSEYNRSHSKNEWQSIMYPEKNPYCDRYGNLK